MCVLAEVAAELRRKEMDSPSYEARIAQQRYASVAATEHSRDPLRYVERFLRAIPRHRALVVYQEQTHA